MFSFLGGQSESEEDLRRRYFDQERKFQTKYFGDVEVVVKGWYTLLLIYCLT